MPTADHREARGAVEVRGTRQCRDRLLRCVDQVGVEVAVVRSWPDAQEAVLRVEHDSRVGPEELRDEVRDADAQVHDLAGAELLRRPRRDPGFRVGAHAAATRWST